MDILLNRVLPFPCSTDEMKEIVRKCETFQLGIRWQVWGPWGKLQTWIHPCVSRETSITENVAQLCLNLVFICLRWGQSVVEFGVRRWVTQSGLQHQQQHKTKGTQIRSEERFSKDDSVIVHFLRTYSIVGQLQCTKWQDHTNSWANMGA